MEKDRLIQLWMANGFIPSKEQTTLHNMGHGIFWDLVWRSFLQDVEEKNDGTILCKMHDLMHDLAQSIMRYECSIVEPHEATKIPDKIRHLSFNIGFGKMAPWNEIVFEVPSLQSVFLFSKDNIASPCISKQKYLRVLDFGKNVDEKLSMSISNFNHLRYLDMSYSNMEILPESISNLQNLQTLKLRHSALRKLPKHMKHMRNLTYLDITGCNFLTSMPDKMGQLTCLQRLSMFIVGQDEGYQIGELKELNLGGTLSIKRLENKLSINFFQGSKFPDWMLGLVLKKLVEISLIDCERCEHLPPLGKLQSLKILEIKRMCSLKYFNHGDYGDGERSFPALKTLEFYEMPSLEEWAIVDRGEICPCLQELVISGCPKLTKLPFLPALESLTIEGGNEMLFRSVINLTSISVFRISDSYLKILPDGLLQNLKALESLRLHNCPELENLSGLENLNSLQKLDISQFDSLTSLPVQALQGLTSLTSLEISGCPEIQSFPEGMQYLNALRDLFISNCGLFSLPNWLGSL
ncbi:putative disease resistance protein RGA4, partial [Camellia sinensis]|uniref:putative disease resistance protein RGA4 n=1 Tax=Camellia sinensis TaxID=4442 RepID=UPI001036A765